MKYSIVTILVGVFCMPLLFAQQSEPAATSSNSLREQYRDLKTDLEVINGFRMIKMYTMDKFWGVIEDSLKTQRSKSREAALTIAAQQSQIASLNASITKLGSEKETLATKVDNMIVFGAAYSKTGVVATASFVVLGLVILSVVLLIFSRTAYNTSRELRKLNESLYQEFDTYKRHAVEKEIKLSRELQNHRNKLAELRIV